VPTASRPKPTADAGGDVIVRIWRGWVAEADAEAYVAYVRDTGLTGYRTTPGNLGAGITTRASGDGRSEVVTVSLWESMDAVSAFAGADPSVAVFYPEDDRYLVARETTVVHIEVEERV
jgi:heme-degrading monooxygenase HmoA